MSSLDQVNTSHFCNFKPTMQSTMHRSLTRELNHAVGNALQQKIRIRISRLVIEEQNRTTLFSYGLLQRKNLPAISQRVTCNHPKFG